MGVYTETAMAKRRSVRVVCTCCEAVLMVEQESGAVLYTDVPKKRNISFEDAVERVRHDKESADTRFKEAVRLEEGRKNLADLKFEEAMKHADDAERPIRPLDLD